MHYHPGGAEELLRGAGRDCTDLFDEYHPWIAEKAYMAPSQHIGSTKATTSLDRHRKVSR